MLLVKQDIWMVQQAMTPGEQALAAVRAAAGRILADNARITDEELRSQVKEQALAAVHAAAERILVHNARITYKELRSRINELNETISQWYELAYQADATFASKDFYDLLVPYMEQDKAIRAHID
jgi:hypothetical protein